MPPSSEVSNAVSRRLIPAVVIVLGLFAAYHLALRALMLHTGLMLGAVGPGTKVYRIVPIYSYIDVHWKLGLAAAIVVIAAAARWLRRRLADEPVGYSETGYSDIGRPDIGVIAKTTLWFLALVVAVALVDGGISRLWRPYEVLKGTDYIGGVEHVESPRVFLRDYATLLPELPDHCRTHPPGPVLFLWSVGRFVHEGPEAAALATICFAGLSIPAVFLLGRTVLGRRRGLLATFLFLAAPNIVLFTATCMDAVFLVFFAWTFFFLWKGRETHPVRYGALGGLTASAVAFFTFSAAVLALWAVVVWVATVWADRERLKSTTICLAAAAAVSILFYTILYWVTGYSLPGVLAAAVEQHRTIMSGGGYETLWQYVHLVIGNAAAFAFGSGVVLVVLVVWGGGRRQEAEGRSGGMDGGSRLFTGCFLVTFLGTLGLPLYTLEVERIWLFFVPLLALWAVRRLDPDSAGFPSLAVAAFVCQAGQAVVMEVFLCTLW